MNGHYHKVSHMRFNLDAVLDDAERRDRKAAEHVYEVCRQLQGLMTPEAYDAWYEQAPDAGFDAMAEAKLAAELVAWEQEERYAESIAAQRVEFVKQIRERNKANPCDFGSAAWFAGVPEEEI